MNGFPLAECPTEARTTDRLSLAPVARGDIRELSSVPPLSLSCRQPCLAEPLNGLFQRPFGVTIIRPRPPSPAAGIDTSRQDARGVIGISMRNNKWLLHGFTPAFDQPWCVLLAGRHGSRESIFSRSGEARL
jgi:hypothetical protein